MKGFPNLLLISAAVPETRLAGSLLIYRLLQTYPPDRLLAIGPKTRAESQLLSCRYEYLRPAPSARFDLTRFAEAKRSLESVGLVGRIPLRRVSRLLRGFQPDVVLTVMERRDYVDAAERFCRANGIPLMLIVHDRVESFDRVYPLFEPPQLRRNGRTYRFASARLCVSPQMEESLREVYGAPGTVLYPNRSEDLTPRPASDSLELKKPGCLTLGYAGAMSYGYGDRIRAAMPLLSTTKVGMRMYSRDTLTEAIPGVEYAGAFSPAEVWKRVQAECDAVWLPYSYDAGYRALYETHFPSKLTEYAALGMPVIIDGPAYATGVKWGISHPSASLTVIDPDPEAMVTSIRRLRDEPSLRVRLAEGARQADQEFDPILIREQFLNAVSTVAARRLLP